MGQRGQALLRHHEHLLLAEPALDDVLVDIAVHARRRPGAALVDEQDVAMAAHMLESVRVAGVKLDGAAARPAREGHEGVGLGLEVQCRDHGHRDLDVGRVRIGGVLRPQHRAAAGLDAGKRRAGADTAVLELQRRSAGDEGRQKHAGQ